MTLDSSGAVRAPPRRQRSLEEIIDREASRKRRRRALGWGLLAIAVAAALAAWLILRPRPVPLAARFRFEPVSHGGVLREVRATGHVEAVTTVQVGAEISGKIASVEVDYNARVTAGQVLARFDRESLLAQLAQAQATLAASRAAVAQASTDRDRTARDLVRVERLYGDKVLSDADHDNAVAAARLNDERVNSAQAQLAAQQAAYSVARTNLDHSIIRAPIDGVVITRSVDPGQTVASALQTPILFQVAADLRKMRVIAAVDEADIGEVAVGQRAVFTVNAYPDRLFDGIVTEVRNSPVVVQDVVTYGTVIEVDNLDLALKPGMTASARVRTASAVDVTRVPAAALRFTPPGSSSPAPGDPGVWVLEPPDSLRRIPIVAGVSDGELTAVAPGPLAPGRGVVTELTPEGRRAYGLAH